MTPGQRDRAIQQAVLTAQQQRDEEEKQQQQQADTVAAAAKCGDSNSVAGIEGKATSNGAGDGGSEQHQQVVPKAAPGTYEPPEWSGVPEG